MNALHRIIRNEDGAALIEYGLLEGLLAGVCLVAVRAIGAEVSTALSHIASALAA